MNTEKIYEFYGVDAKSEIRMCIVLAVCILLMMFIPVFIYEYFIVNRNHTHTTMNIVWLNILLAILGGGSAITVGTILSKSEVVLRFLGKKYKKLWELRKSEKMIVIKYDNLMCEIFLEEIIKVKIYGNSKFKYFTIKTQNKTIKIRVGISWLTPFSREGDVQILDSFVEILKPYLDKNFTKKDKALSISPDDTVKLTYTKKHK